MRKTIYTTKVIFKEIVRDKFFLFLGLGGIIFFLLTLIFNEMVVGERAKVTKDLTLSALNLFPFIFLLIYGTRLISREIETKSIYTILIRPFKKWEYFLANLLSLFLSTLILNIFIMVIGSLTIFLFYGELWIVKPLIHLFFTMFESLLLSGFAILFSSLFSSSVSLMLFFLIYGIGHSIEESLRSLAEGSGVALKPILSIIKFILPNLSFFDYKTELLYSLKIPDSVFYLSPLYSITYTFLIFLIAIYFFKRKEL